MATFARLAPQLRRLFIRFDEAEATDATLGTAHAYWNMKRGDHILPRLTDISLDELIAYKARLFLFEKHDDGDWSLRFAGDRVRDEFVARDGWPRLSSLADRRLAVRLRRLFRYVAKRAMAVSATFVTHGHTAEILAMPLATANHRVGAIFGGLAGTVAAHPQSASTPHRPPAQPRHSRT